MHAMPCKVLLPKEGHGHCSFYNIQMQGRLLVRSRLLSRDGNQILPNRQLVRGWHSDSVSHCYVLSDRWPHKVR